MNGFDWVAAAVVALGGFAFLYTYLGYPALLWVLGRGRRRPPVPDLEIPEDEWPSVSISVPAYNEESQIKGLIESLLALEYPRDRIQILVVSDASSDQTDEIVAGYADQGVELLRMPERGGKTKAENAAAALLRGEIVVNTDASIRIPPGSLKPLIAAFRDPEVGLASGRDVSVAAGRSDANVGESGYVGYEMAVRDLETRVGSIVGASGCFYAIRADLHRTFLPESLSRDFAAALVTREHGFRAVSVPAAVCHVPRTESLHREYRRKVRTIARGMDTLLYKRALLNPLRYGLFSWMLFSHKICRWVLPWLALGAWLSLGVLGLAHPLAMLPFGAGLAVLLLAWLGWIRSGRGSVSRALAIPAYFVAGSVAAMVALIQLLKGDRNAVWEPTRREMEGMSWVDGARFTESANSSSPRDRPE